MAGWLVGRLIYLKASIKYSTQKHLHDPYFLSLKHAIAKASHTSIWFTKLVTLSSGLPSLIYEPTLVRCDIEYGSLTRLFLCCFIRCFYCSVH